MIDAFTTLREDHKRVAAILKELEETTERAVKTREKLFDKLKSEIKEHSRTEEEIMYPLFKEVKELEEITLEAYEEHHVVDTLLSELDALAKDQPEWGAKLTVLKENIEHHVEEEEGEMFKNARNVLKKDQLDKLKDSLEVRKSISTIDLEATR